MPNSTEFIQQLLEFRTTYLRALSRGTVDLPFRTLLTTDPLETFKVAYGYDCPWFMTLELQDEAAFAPRLDLAAGAVVTLPYLGEAITVYLPERPVGKSPKFMMDALSAYYHENPWFLHNKKPSTGGGTTITDGTGTGGGGVAGGGGGKSSRNVNTDYTHGGKWQSVADDRDRNNRFDLGDNFDDFISFAAALFNALALSWDNNFFWRELTAWKGPFSGSNPATGKPKQTVNLLNEWLGYDYPWELDLIVQPDTTATYNESTGEWENTTPPNLMLTLPRMTGATGATNEASIQAEVAANATNVGTPILGVALYNTDGPGYPFTCG